MAAPAHAGWRADAPFTVSGPIAELAGCGLDGDDNTPQLAADPRHPQRLLLTYLAGDDSASVAARSTDGGRTWSRSVLRGITTCTGGGPGRIGDPGAFVGPDGTAYAQNSYIAEAPQQTDVNHDGIRVYVSTAARRSAFGAPVDVDPLQPGQRGYFAAAGRRVLMEVERVGYAGALSPGPTGPYLTGPPNQIVVYATADSGRGWRSLTPIQALPGRGLLAGGLLADHRTIVAIATEIDYSTLAGPLVSGGILPVNVVAYRSTDGGRTWSLPVELAHQCGFCALNDASTGRDGSMLVSWLDQHADGTTEINVARSDDTGATWSAHHAATAHRATDEQVQTAVAGDGDGAIGVLYYDGTQAAGKPMRAMLAMSQDGGTTWEQLALSPEMSVASLTNPHFDTLLGPEIDLLARGHGFLAAYTTLAPFPLADGQQDVAVQRVTP
jgi:hypothetical protein